MAKKPEKTPELDALLKELRGEARNVTEDLLAHLEDIKALGYIGYVGYVVLGVGVFWAGVEALSPWSSPIGIFSLIGAVLFIGSGATLIFIGHQTLVRYRYPRILKLEKAVREAHLSF